MTGLPYAAASILVVLGFGFLVPVVLFRLREPFSLAAITTLFGSAFFLVSANALSYVMPVGSACFTVISIMALTDIALLLRWFRHHEGSMTLDRSERIGLGILTAFGIVAAFMCARFVGSDPWSWQHFPLASTIVSGNFPVMSPIDPLSPLRYHYAPAFLAAAFRLLTGLPLSVGFALQPAFGAFGILFAVAAFCRSQKTTVMTAVCSALLALAGGGLTWLKAPQIIDILTGRNFAGLWELVSSPITTSPLIFLGHRSTALGFPLLFGLVLCIAFALQDDVMRRRLTLVVGFFLALALTLSMEMAFGTLCLAAAVTAVLLLVSPVTRVLGARLTLFGLLVLVPALLLSLLQGGVLSGLSSGGHTFSFHPSLRITIDTFGSTVVPWSMRFLRDFGIPLLLLPFALFVSFRRFRTQPLWMLLCVLGLIHFLLPFLIEYQLIQGEMRRAFYVSTSVFSLLVGFAVSDLLFVSAKRSVRTAGYVLIGAMLVSSLLYTALRIVIPTGRLEAAPLFAGMPSVSESQETVYAWVRNNTTQRDFFYVRNLTIDFRNASEPVAQMRDRILFTTYTGRFTVGPIIFWDYDTAWLEDVLVAEKTCTADSMRALHVTYLFVPDQERAEWFTATCRPSDWSLRYDTGATYPRIYELAAERAI